MDLTFACFVWAGIFACLAVLAWVGDRFEGGS